MSEEERAGEGAGASASAAASVGAPDAASVSAPEAVPATDAEAAPVSDVEAAPVPDDAPTSDAPAPSDPEAEAAARELAEHNALADVFDDVRTQSADSALVTPSRWEEIGLVPAHMTPEEFEMFVYEYLEDYLKEHKQELADERARKRAKAHAVRSATHAVGVPPKIPNRRLAQIEADNEAGKDVLAAAEAAAAAAAVPVAPAPEPADDAAADTDAADAAASESGTLAPDDSPFAGLRIPEGHKLVQIEGEWCLVEDEDAEPVRREINCKHVVALVGQGSYYLYDSDFMTDSYANWAFLAAEDDPMATFVNCVREDGRVYPRPFTAIDLENPPFNMSSDEIERTWEQVRDSGKYPDIERTEASNGDVYYYSTLYISKTYADSLAEWLSVERPRSV